MKWLAKRQFGKGTWSLVAVLALALMDGQAVGQCTTPPSGLVSWWLADGSANDIQSGNNGTLVAGATFAVGKVGQGFAFSGGFNDAVVVPDAPNLNFGVGADFSIEAWVALGTATRTNGVNVIVDKRLVPATGPGVGYVLFVSSNGRLAFQLADGSATNFIAAPQSLPTDGMFHHVAVTVDRDSASGGQLYVDGQVVLAFNPTSHQGNLTNAQPFLIGKNSLTGFNEAFDGVLDEVSLYGRVLGSTEIQAIFDAGSAGKCDAAAVQVHGYQFNGDFLDDFGGPSLVPNGGTLSGGRYFFGANQGLSLISGLVDTQDYSIEMVVEHDALSPFWRKLIDFRQLSSDIGLYARSNRLAHFTLAITGAPNVFFANVDAHVVMTRDGATGLVKGYLNGVLQWSANDISSKQGVAPNNVLIFFEDDFRTGRGEAQSGSVECIAIYDGALTSAEVADLFNNTPCAGLISDSDGDGVSDPLDNCPFTPNSDQADSDGDGRGDVCDICPGFNDFLDNDGDGIPDGCDDCPNDPDNDADGDGVCGDVDICPGFDDSLDNDGDGIPDGCDDDDDNDGLTDAEEIALQVFGGCPNPFEPDSDFDGINDFIEVTLGLNPCGTIDDDQDGDGLTDAAELNTHGTDPNNVDTDGDGMEDGTEVDVAAGGNCPDPLNLDSDGDTLVDGAEVDAGTDPCSTDTDGDGVPDNIDPLPLNPGVTGDVEADLRSLCNFVASLPLDAYKAPNNNAKKGRRNALCNKLNSAAKSVTKGEIQKAIDSLNSLIAKLDGDPTPRDWMVESVDKLIVHDTAVALRSLLELELAP